jgi:MFS transporter, DHA1 family, multidrug resistance protein
MSMPMSISEERETVNGRVIGHNWRVLAILGMLMGFGSISTDLCLPALPVMGDALGADQGTMELTLSGYLIGFSLGQLLWGPISARRRSGSCSSSLALPSAGCQRAPAT